MQTEYTHICAYCGKQFNPVSSRNLNRYCGLKCSGLAKRNTPEAFWGMVDKSNGADSCWIWHGTIHYSGYGVVSWCNRSVQAHRVAYELTKGAIPDGMQILHSCDTPLCCNPSHLSYGTCADNLREISLKGRSRKNHSPHKLTWESVNQIRSLILGNTPFREIARRYSIHPTTVYDIATGRSWGTEVTRVRGKNITHLRVMNTPSSPSAYRLIGSQPSQGVAAEWIDAGDTDETSNSN